MRPANEPVMTTWPLFLRTRSGTNALRPFTTPIRLTSISQRHVSTLVSSTEPEGETPALRQTMSTGRTGRGPGRESASMSSLERTSHWTAMRRRPLRPHLAHRVVERDLLDVSQNDAGSPPRPGPPPRARPIPLAPPVTTATRPASHCMRSDCCCGEGARLSPELRDPCGSHGDTSPRRNRRTRSAPSRSARRSRGPSCRSSAPLLREPRHATPGGSATRAPWRGCTPAECRRRSP